MKNIIARIIIVLSLICICSLVVSANNFYHKDEAHAVVEAYLNACVNQDAKQAVSYLMQKNDYQSIDTKDYPVNYSLHLITDAATMEELILQDNLTAFTIHTVTPTVFGWNVRVAASSSNHDYESIMVVRSTNGKLLIDYEKCEIINQDLEPITYHTSPQ